MMSTELLFCHLAPWLNNYQTSLSSYSGAKLNE
ncbi:hypothetical protein BH10CYA1_BH10CYA1_48160 [soil metagenome]